MAKKREARKHPTQARSRELVDAVLLAVGELATDQGIEKLTMPALSRRSGVSLASMYEYFPTKEAIFAAWAERAWERAFGAVAARVQANVVEQLSVSDGVLAVVRSLNGELRPFAKAFKQCRFDFNVGRGTRRAELTDAVAELVLGVLTTAPKVAEECRITHLPVGAQLVATLLCSDTYVDLLGSKQDPEAVDAAVARMVSLFITGAA